MPDPLLIVFVSQTGNAGKTMLATALGCELASRFATVLIDADHEHRKLGWSAATWAKHDRLKKQPQRDCFVNLSADDGNAIAEHIEANRHADFILIDCPSRAGLTNLKIAAIADLVVFPIPTGAKDFALSRNTLKLMLSGLAASRDNGLATDIPPIPPQHIAIVPTRTHSQAEADAARVWLAMNCGDNLNITPPLMERPAYANAIARGLTITEAAHGLAAKALAITDAITAQALALHPCALQKLDSAA